jgi:hypothetical protein
MKKEMEISPQNPPKFICKCCDLVTSNKKDYNLHLLTRKHANNSGGEKNEPEKEMEDSQFPPNFPQQEAQTYTCECCNLTTTSKKDYNNHLLTRKHQKKQQGVEGYSCACGKEYACNGSLWRHKKKCDGKPVLRNVLRPYASRDETTELLITLVKQNKEFQEFLFNELKEARAQATTTNNNTMTNTMTNNNTNSHNKTFNINMFLNDRCKNAMNIMDFVNSLDVTTKDLERTGQVGFVNGITSIIMDGLRGLDMYTLASQSIHCTDLKRETVYVKDEDTWKKDEDKDGEEKPIFRMAVKRVASRNLRQLTQWKLENPECEDGMSKASDDFVTISQTALGGITKDDDEKYQNNIMRNVLKKVTIDKGAMTVA